MPFPLQICRLARKVSLIWHQLWFLFWFVLFCSAFYTLLLSRLSLTLCFSESKLTGVLFISVCGKQPRFFCRRYRTVFTVPIATAIFVLGACIALFREIHSSTAQPAKKPKTLTVPATNSTPGSKSVYRASIFLSCHVPCLRRSSIHQQRIFFIWFHCQVKWRVVSWVECVTNRHSN